MAFDVIVTTLSADLALNGTFTVAYPANRTAGSYTGGWQHKLFAGGKLRSSPTDFTVAFTTVATITYKGTTTIPAGSRVEVQLDRVGRAVWGGNPAPLTNVNTLIMDVARVDLGSPAAGAANNLSVSAAVLAATATGAVLLALAAALDVPRNVVAAWTGTSVLSITGTDVYGNVIHESSASGTSFTGKKAFKTVTLATFSADVTGCTIGTGNVLGLPVFLAGTGFVLRELQDGVAPTAGTIVAGVTSAATATTGDVRGTYAPNATPDGAKDFALICALESLASQGVTQF